MAVRVIAAVAWTYVLLTYEVATVLTPTLCVLVWWVTRRWVRALPLLLPAALITAVVSVVWGYVGVALLIAAGWAALAERPQRGWRRLALSVATAVVALAAAGSVAQSVTVAAVLAANPH